MEKFIKLSFDTFVLENSRWMSVSMPDNVVGFL